jgi:hypothetical protein
MFAENYTTMALERPFKGGTVMVCRNVDMEEGF